MRSCTCGNSIKKKMLGNACIMRTSGDILFRAVLGNISPLSLLRKHHGTNETSSADAEHPHRKSLSHALAHHDQRRPALIRDELGQVLREQAGHQWHKRNSKAVQRSDSAEKSARGNRA